LPETGPAGINFLLNNIRYTGMPHKTREKITRLRIILYLGKKNRMFGRLVLILLLGASPLAAQESAPGLLISCPGHPFPGSPGVDLPLRQLRISERPSSKFTPRYFQVPDSVQKVVEAAFNVWNKILISPVPIHVDVHWEALNSGTLATAGSDRVFKNFKNAPLRDVWYPSALADALSGQSVNDNKPDIILKINSNAQWNLDYEGPLTFRYYDMLSVIIHEIAHGIGFMSSFEMSGTTRVKWGIQNLPFVYDRYITDQAGNSLVNNRFYTNDSEELLKEVTERNVFFQIDSGAYSQHRPRLHTENPFSAGASLSHIANGSSSQSDSRDRLMLPTLSPGSRYHYPGNGILAMLFQMGWALNFYEFEREYGYVAGSFALYPNPGTDHVQLKINNFTPGTTLQYQLLDATGRMINSRQVDTGETEISLKELSAGRYYLRIGGHSLPLIKL